MKAALLVIALCAIVASARLHSNKNNSIWSHQKQSNQSYGVQIYYKRNVTYGNWSNWNRTNRLEAGNIQQCLQDSIKVIVDVKDFVQAIKNGTKDISSILIKVKVIAADIEALIKDCGSFSLMATMDTKINDQNCFADIAQLVKLSEKLISEGVNKHIVAFIKDAFALYKLAKQTINDCKAHRLLTEGVGSNFNFTKCLNSAKVHFSLVQSYLHHLNTTQKNASLLFDDISAITKHTSVTLVDCSLEIAAQKIQSILPDQCVDELNYSSKIGIKILGELDNIFQVVQDISAFIQSFQTAKKTCPFLSELQVTTA